MCVNVAEKKTAESKQTEEYVGVAVPLDKRTGWTKPALVWLGFSISFANLVIGGQIEKMVGMPNAVGAILLGNLGLVIYAGLLAVISGKTGFSFPMVAKATFGEKGAIVPALLMAVLGNFWFAYNSWMLTDVCYSVLGGNPTVWCIVLVNICWLGTLAYKYMVALGKAVVPVVVFLACYFVIRLILPAGGAAFHSAPTAAAPFITAFGTAFGTFVVSGTMTGDIVRYCKGTKDSIIVTIFAFFVGNSGSLILGALASAAVPGIDQYFGMTAFLGGIPLIICAGISQWSTASSCLYNAVSGYTNIFRKLGWTKAVIIGGVGGSLVAVSGFISDLAAYMSFLGILVPPVGGVIIADYYLVRKGLKYGDKNLSGVNWWAIASLVVAVILSYISSKVFPAVPHQAVGIIVSAVMYAIVGRRVSYDKVG